MGRSMSEPDAHAPGSASAGPIVDRYPFCWRSGIERIRQVWRVALHPKFRPEIRMLRPVIGNGAGCLDIGANHGRFAFELARCGHRVLAFEPLAFNLAIIRPAARMHRSVRVMAHALGEESGSSALYVPIRADRRPEHGSGFIAASDAVAQERSGGRTLVREPIIIDRLDDVDCRWVGRVGFIKMDVEGHEASVLRGGRGLIDRDKPAILLECQTGNVGLDALRELVAMGYLLRDLDERERGSWTADAAGLHARVASGAKSHDVLAWQGSRGEPPAFATGFESTRFGR
jgi:FkbM family methyltransferase